MINDTPYIPIITRQKAFCFNNDNNIDAEVNIDEIVYRCLPTNFITKNVQSNSYNNNENNTRIFKSNSYNKNNTKIVQLCRFHTF